MNPARIYFRDPSLDGQFARTLTCAYAHAADLGEAFLTAHRIGDKSSSASDWYDEWSKTAISVEALASTALDAGHTVTARDAFLRASEYYRQAFYFTRGDLDSPALRKAYEHHVSTFRKAAQLTTECVVRSIDVPFGDATLPGYFFSVGRKPRPTIFMPCGYDSTAESAWYQIPDAIRRGYNVVVVEGPGQGGVLYDQRLFFRPDFETVASAIVDWMVDQPQIKSDELVMIGRSFAGYLAPRAAAFEHRFAALVVDPAQPDMGARVPDGLKGKLAVPVIALQMRTDPMRAEFFRARMSAHGISDVGEYFDALSEFTMLDVAGDIQCPTLIVESQNDFAGGDGAVLLEALDCEKELVTLTDEVGVDGHCGGLGQIVWAATVYDWLDTTLAESR